MNVRKYRCGDAILYPSIRQCCVYCRNFTTELSTRGITPEYIEDLYEQTKIWMNTISSTVPTIQRMEKVLDKNLKRQNLLSILTELRYIVRRSLLSQPYILQCFPLAGLTKLNNAELIQRSRLLAEKCAENAAVLAPMGITPEYIAGLLAAAAALEEAIPAPSSSLAAAMEKTAERIAMGNELYEKAKHLAHITIFLIKGTDPTTAHLLYKLVRTMNTLPGKRRKSQKTDPEAAESDAQ